MWTTLGDADCSEVADFYCSEISLVSLLAIFIFPLLLLGGGQGTAPSIQCIAGRVAAEASILSRTSCYTKSDPATLSVSAEAEKP